MRLFSISFQLKLLQEKQRKSMFFQPSIKTN